MSEPRNFNSLPCRITHGDKSISRGRRKSRIQSKGHSILRGTNHGSSRHVFLPEVEFALGERERERDVPVYLSSTVHILAGDVRRMRRSPGSDRFFNCCYEYSSINILVGAARDLSRNLSRRRLLRSLSVSLGISFAERILLEDPSAQGCKINTARTRLHTHTHTRVHARVGLL